MRLTGLLVTVAVLGYVAYTYLGASSGSSVEGVNTTPAEYTDRTKKSVDALNEVLKKQRQQLEGAK